MAGIVCACECSSEHGSGKRAPQPPIKYTLVFTVKKKKSSEDTNVHKEPHVYAHNTAQTDI